VQFNQVGHSSRYGIGVTTETAAPVRRRLPVWAILLIAAASAFVLLIAVTVTAIVVAVLTEPVTGPEDAAALKPSSCVLEPESNLPTYTVVDCETPHAQQVVAEIDLGRNTQQYTTASSLTSYAGEICARFLEYGLFVTDAVDDSFEAQPLGVPSPEAVAAGITSARCSVIPIDRSPLTGSIYRPMP